MTDKEGEENAPREWEVVSLTASAYAAAPGPKQVEVKDDDNDNDNAKAGAETETSRALFMSGHFIFPPSQHENLPLEHDKSEIVDEDAGNVASGRGVEEGGRSSGKDDENLALKGLNVSEEFPGVPFSDEKGSRISIPVSEFEESTTLQDNNLSGKEQSIYSTAAFSSFHSETGLSGLTAYGDNLNISDAIESSEPGLDLTTMDASDSPKSSEDRKCGGSAIPCEAWWKKRAASLYTHATEANTVWSIFIAAAVMGLVIIGQRWQQERWQVLQLKWQASLTNEKSGKVLGPIFRLKDVIVGGHRRGAFIRGSSASE